MLLSSFVVIPLAVVLGACGGSSSKSGSPTTSPGVTAHKAIPVGTNPSESAKMVCEPAAINDIEQSATQVHATSVTKPTWKDHVYSCTLKYPGGAQITMSVKELSNTAETDAFFKEQGDKLGNTGNLNGLGQGAFTTRDGVVVRKDYKVLTVDTSRLPASFGGETRGNVAINVGAVIMSCWTGE
jgi:hypothetical protein